MKTKHLLSRWFLLLLACPVSANLLATGPQAASSVRIPFRDTEITVAGLKRSLPTVINGRNILLRSYDQERISRFASSEKKGNLINPGSPLDVICGLQSLAEHGEIVPKTNGGTLDPIAFINPTAINLSGRIAFISLVDGSERNQGAIVGNADGSLTSIAIGCGAGGGSGDTTSLCGDPSPIGGNFSGFFLGTFFAPDTNDSGDVLFFCEVNGASSRRGLFLYRGATGEIVKVAAVGDPSPLGGTFATVGPGSLNNHGKVVFLASPSTASFPANIFLWDNGVLTKVAAVGDPAPDGGTFSDLGAESLGFADGTTIPVGPIPDINDSDQVCFKAFVAGGQTERGLIVQTAGVNAWYVKVPDPTPIGGTYFDMQAASINNAGQIAFFADYNPTPETFNSGWFAGAPENWRKVIVFFDEIDGGECLGLAFSRNPMQTIDAEGNVVFWTSLDSNGTSDRLVLGLTDGTLLVAARRGDPTPIGGTFGSMDAWPAVTGNNGTLNVATPGAQNGALSAHMTFTRCATQGLELTAASSKTGPFEIDLPLTGPAGIECRGGRASRHYTMVFTFNNLLTSVDGAATTCGSVSALKIAKADAHRVFVSLRNVICNEDFVTVTLEGVHDDQGNILSSAAATMGVLLGDTTADGVVDQSDVDQTSLVAGEKTNSDNFRNDVNASGRITTKDLDRVKAKVGTMLPP
jgi:hypothetical protein